MNLFPLRYRLNPLFVRSGAALLVLAAIATAATYPQPSRAAGDTVLYDGSLSGASTPNSQNMAFLPPLPGAQTFANGATTLTTSSDKNIRAGYTSKTQLTLDRNPGYVIRFTVQVVSEDHAGSDTNSDGIGDRAGFSIIALSSDLHGIELGFWANEVWAQDDATNPMFTHAEGQAFNTTTGLIPYELRIQGDSYTLSSSGTTILTGPLRNYSSSSASVYGYEIYKTQNFLFLGDDTTSASATMKLSYVSVGSLAVSPTNTPTSLPTDTPTNMPIPSPTAPSGATATPTTSPTPGGTSDSRYFVPVVLKNK